MTDLAPCWIKNTDDDIATGWYHTDEKPYIFIDEKHNGFDVVCPCCFLNSGVYPTEQQAIARWNNLFKRKISLDDYAKLDHRAKFPDHVEPSWVVLKNG